MKTFTLRSDGRLGHYDYLSALSPDRWAWEYLRRNADFRRDAALIAEDNVSERTVPRFPSVRILRPRVSQSLAERWGLVFMPDPEKCGLEADAVWSHYVFPGQVEVNCTPRKPDQTCDIWQRVNGNCTLTHVTDLSAREYLLARGTDCVIQIRCTGMSLLSIEPVRMKLQISDMAAIEKKLMAQKALANLAHSKPDVDDARWTKTSYILRNGLIVLDCQGLGMKQREIAALIYGEEAVAADWGDDSSALRSQLRYVIRKAEGLRDGGYLVELLGARSGPDSEVA
ncbi:MAG: transcriptional regulator domain-containing protein [Hyphomonas sp.]